MSEKNFFLPKQEQEAPVSPEAVKAADDFLAEMKLRREAAGAPIVETPHPITQRTQRAPVLASTRGGVHTTETGIIGYLIKKRWVSNRTQANYVLVGIMIINIMITAWVLWPQRSPKIKVHVPTVRNSNPPPGQSAE